MVETEYVKRKVSELKKADKNPRLHPDKQMVEYKRSVDKYGLLKIPVIDENNQIWIGNGLYDAMVASGVKETYCILKKGLTEAEKKKMMLAENRIFDLGVDDMKVFDEFLSEFEDFDIPGFDDDLLKSLVADVGEVDSMMSDYGIVDESKKKEIAEAHTTYERQNNEENADEYSSSASEEMNGTSAPSEIDNEDETTEQHKYVICPKCGERIWL